MSEPKDENRRSPGLDDGRAVLYFDYVDPGSYLLSVLLDDVELSWRGFEIRPPPGTPVDPREQAWAQYQTDALEYARAVGVEMKAPRMVPWTRKAHELDRHAEDQDCSEAVRSALFRAHFVDGLDIGRIDVLVELARSVGLDGSETKAALDVDHWAAQVESDRAFALEHEVAGVPTITARGARLEGLRSMNEIRDWLAAHD